MTESNSTSPTAAKGKNTNMAMLAYVFFPVPLLTEDKNDPFVKFHLKQAIVLVLAAVAVSVVGSIIPFIGWFLIAPLGSVAILVLWVIGIINALNGEEKELPVIGSYAQKILKF
ncbi:MAG: hypothetical protein UW75_C0040G0005 [Parcubacteria group bacterium GW2011_GWF2_44_8]|nr:MAG: hypothetical protein UW75_C0040G0005 [Parcubacteria group bacterium GW2011_GWF2_44_8]